MENSDINHDLIWIKKFWFQ